MARPRLSPPPEELAKYDARGLTDEEIVSDWYERTGNLINRKTVRSARSRAGMNSKRERFEDTVPPEWGPVAVEHDKDIDLTYLRRLGRRLKGLPLSDYHSSLLDSWLRQLEEDRELIFYTRTLGFVRVSVDTLPGDYRLDADYVRPGIPVLRRLPPKA